MSKNKNLFELMYEKEKQNSLFITMQKDKLNQHIDGQIKKMYMKQNILIM